MPDTNHQTTLAARLESLLFIATHPLSIKKLAELTEHTGEEVEQALDQMRTTFQETQRGIELSRNGKSVELVTASEHAKLIQRYITDERTGELTKPALETLTIIAYRGPVAKSELEIIRGVNCSLILRNLLMRGLVETVSGSRGDIRYQVTFEFLHHLGVRAVEELPDYDALHTHQHLERLLHPERFEEDTPGSTEAAASEEPQNESST